MIRSLVTPLQVHTSNGAIPDDPFTPRRNLSPEALETVLEDGATCWIDMVNPGEDEIHWLEQVLHLHPAVVEDLLRVDARPALMVYPKYLFLSLFQPSLRLNRVEAEEIHCLIGENFFITVRTSQASATDSAYKRIAQNADNWNRGPAYFLYLTAQYVVDAYYPLLDRISIHLNTMEDDLMVGNADPKARKPIYRIKQQLIALRQMVAPQREVLSNLIGEERLSGRGDIRDLFRHLYERLLWVYDVVDAQRDLSSDILDMMQGQESRSMVEAVNRLTIFSMIFLPLTFFSGLVELNFATTTDPVVLPITGRALFIIVIGLMVFSATAMTYVFKRKGWL